MITITPKEKSFAFSDAKLNDIINTHLRYMECFSEDDDIKYSVIIPENEEDVKTIEYLSIDSVNITGDYYEANIIIDDSVTVAVIHRDLVSDFILSKIDSAS